jgi:large subunit ribosomal protein L3
MNPTGLLGKKIEQTQGFLEDGTRIPLSLIAVKGNVVTNVRTQDKDGYTAIQMGFGINTKATKPLAGIAKKAGLKESPRFFREVRVEDVAGFENGSAVNAEEVFKPGDIIDITGTSKGKGYAGVVKRYHFKGGPKTHGQSDRHRAPGSSGQGTTPGRVYKGKRMSGHMGAEQVTIKNLLVMDVVDGIMYVKGLIPGFVGQFVVIKKRGEKKQFMPLFKRVDEAPEEEVAVLETVEEAASVNVEPATTEEVQEQEAEIEAAEEVKAEKKETAESRPEDDQPLTEKEEVKEGESV